MAGLLIVISFLLSVPESSPQAKKFQWLVGKWKVDGKEEYEVWNFDDQRILRGLSFRITHGGDTAVTETIALIYSEGHFHYVPDVAGDQPPIDFKVTYFDDKSFVAENPQHDFPKKITYRCNNRNQSYGIQATIEGNGRSISYSFSRIE